MTRKRRTDVATTDGRNLEMLATEANEMFAKCKAGLVSGLAHAVECGKVLQVAKAKVPRGAFDGWLEGNFDGSRAIAYKYLSLAAKYPLLGVDNLDLHERAQQVGVNLDQQKALAMLVNDFVDYIDLVSSWKDFVQVTRCILNIEGERERIGWLMFGERGQIKQ